LQRKIKSSSSIVKNFHVLEPTAPDRTLGALCALAVMTKAPHPGRVKTRLVPPLTPVDAAELNKCFLRDTAAAILTACNQAGTEKETSARGVAVYTPADAASAYEDVLPPDFLLLPQRGEGFGERLCLAAADLFRCGFGSVCLIDSDSPTVPAENFAEAVRLLRDTGDRTVLGPSDDGGYYLIGLKSVHSELFDKIDWSTERVLEQTAQRAQESGLEIKFLPTGFDVDDDSSLRRLESELMSNRALNNHVAPHTREFLRRLSSQGKL